MPVAALTRSEHGSVVVTEDEVIEVPAHPVEELVDTTGAGDLYASGFLFGYSRGMDLATCGALGSLAAAEVISHLGRVPRCRWPTWPRRCRGPDVADGAGRPGLTVVEHPLVQHKLHLLRDRNTESGEFRRLCREITLLAAYEALADLELEPVTVETPITSTMAFRLRHPEPAVVGILRAGLAMVDAVLELLPQAAVGHLGMYRDPVTHQPVDYYAKLPDRMDERAVLVVDPMLATGGSAVGALDQLVARGCTDIRLLCIVGCPEGVAAVREAHPEVPITLAAMDERLNDSAYIVPGLGDAGDRIFGTR